MDGHEVLYHPRKRVPQADPPSQANNSKKRKRTAPAPAPASSPSSTAAGRQQHALLTSAGHTLHGAGGAAALVANSTTATSRTSSRVGGITASSSSGGDLCVERVVWGTTYGDGALGADGAAAAVDPVVALRRAATEKEQTKRARWVRRRERKLQLLVHLERGGSLLSFLQQTSAPPSALPAPLPAASPLPSFPASSGAGQPISEETDRTCLQQNAGSTRGRERKPSPAGGKRPSVVGEAEAEAEAFDVGMSASRLPTALATKRNESADITTPTNAPPTDPLVQKPESATEGGAMTAALNDRSQPLALVPVGAKATEKITSSMTETRAEREAWILGRASTLQREGLWSARRLAKVAEAPRGKAHWDYVLEEMAWMAHDFAEERRFKMALARRVSKEILRYHQIRRTRDERKARQEELGLRRLASSIARDVLNFWQAVEKLVRHKHQTRLDQRKREVLDKHLDFLVGQTERYSTMLAEELAAPLPAKTALPSSPMQTSVIADAARDSPTETLQNLKAGPPSPAGGDLDEEYLLELDKEAIQVQCDDETTLEQEEAQQGPIDRNTIRNGSSPQSKLSQVTIP